MITGHGCATQAVTTGAPTGAVEFIKANIRLEA